MLQASIQNMEFETPLGAWRVSTLAPPPDLADAVEEFWEVTGYSEYSHEKHLPRGAVELMFNLGDPYDVLDPNDLSQLETYKNAWISGHQDGPLYVAPARCKESRKKEHLVAARLTAAGAYALFGYPGHGFTNQVIELDRIWTPGTDLLREQLYHANSPAERFQILITYVRTCRKRAGKELSDCVVWTLSNLHKTNGRSRITDLCANFGVSRKHLTKCFSEEVGFSPKRFARILKFSAIIDALGEMETIQWSDFAIASGYYDQAHFIKEFRAFSGGTPNEFLRVRSPDGRSAIYE